MKLRYHYRKLTHPKSKLLLETAYHEAGHTCYSYIAGFFVNSVEIDIINAGNGTTQTNFEASEWSIINALKSLSIDPSVFNNLPMELQHQSPSTFHRYIDTLLAGPIAEGKYIGLRDSNPNNHVNLQNSDFISYRLMVMGFNQVLAYLNLQTINSNYVQMKLIQINEIMDADEVWSSIMEISKALVGSKSGKLEREEIEKILNRTGLINLIESMKIFHTKNAPFS